MGHPTIITGDEIFDEFRSRCVPVNYIIFDNRYVMPTRKFIDGKFTSALYEHFKYINATYEDEIFDCDDFAREAWSYINICHARTRPGKYGIAFGIVTYFRKHVMHTINFYVTRSGLMFYEPQLMKTIKLTKDEISSITKFIV